MSQPQKTYRFTPRPEAHAMQWDDLLQPVREAVHGLLMRVAGAEETRRAVAANRTTPLSDDVGNCFLVYGGRGTGKTTVLKSAQKAVSHAEPGRGFFPAAIDPSKPLDLHAQVLAQQLQDSHHIVWLETLDLEPLPASTNLLTTLLTRVRNALDADDRSHGSSRATSLFEESADDARQLLDRLINDATLMWEEIQEPDTRNKANRHRAAAEIYANFDRDFKRAMDALSRRLDLWHSHDQGCAILLPIDNIDRSTEHLKSIVKLAQMVSHPCLWLVMAGDRVEVETFLERAYWTELIHGHAGADARGKAAQSGEDETLGMARRQAHAAAQKVWPPSHRVEVDFVRPAEVLKFHPPGETLAHSIGALLSVVPVHCFVPAASASDATGPDARFHHFPLLGLFAFDQARGDRPKLTRAGTHALHLPARAVLDLWQLAHWVATTNDHAHGAVKIVRTMLRSAIASSDLPSTLGQQLQHQIILRDPEGGTLLSFDPARLSTGHRMSVVSEVSLAAAPCEPGQDLGIRSTLRARPSRDMRLTLAVATGGPDTAQRLPELVAAWLMILYDILIYEPRLAVLGGTTIDIPLVAAHHDLVWSIDGQRLRQQQVLSWSAPDFGTVCVHDQFWRHWECFLSNPAAGCHCCGGSGKPCATHLALGWLRCAIQTFVDTSPFPGELPPCPDGAAGVDALLDGVARLYAVVRPDTEQPLSRRRTFDSTALCDWLDNKLPLLFTQLHAPASGSSRCHDSVMAWIKTHPDAALVAHWRRNRLFLLAEVGDRLARVFADGKKLPPSSRSALEDWACGDLRAALG